MIYTAAADYAAAAIFSFCEKHGSFNGNERSGREQKTFDDHLFWCTLKWIREGTSFPSSILPFWHKGRLYIEKLPA